MASGATAAEDTPAERPVYLSLRYDENWGVLRHPTIRTDPFDRVKYLPIGGHEDRYVSIGGEGRLRFERYKNPGFGSEPNDPNGYLLQRYLLHAELHWAQHLRLFSQLQSG